MKNLNFFFFFKGYLGDFPGGLVVKNLPCNDRDAGSIPDCGTKIPHAVEQLVSPGTTTREFLCHNEISHMMQQRLRMPQPRPEAAK